MKTTNLSEKAIEFINVDNNRRFSVTPEAVEFLQSLKGKKLGVISIVGKYRTGKSFIVNRVLLNKVQKGFKVGPTIMPCTKVLFCIFIKVYYPLKGTMNMESDC